MPGPDYTIRPFQPSDLAQSTEILYNAKLGLTINRLLYKNWPNAAAQRQNYRSTLENLDPATMESLTVVDNDTGEVVGHITVTRKNPSALEVKKDIDTTSAGPQIPDYFDPEVLAAVQATAAKLDKQFHDLDHLELTYIIVKSEHRGREIGARLMEHVFNKSRSLGVPIALVSEPQVLDFFLRQGFRERKYVDIDLAQWAPANSGFGDFRLTGMIWYPDTW
ncbi:acyl-CoA N-acyltransferase [Aspergillus karnatakaensis]|uniref:GNAT family N-acetyltransferase n=1 Tax=Aspergillus karnatakaensis TaxID=1810916 RepID=UPI003CCD2B97